MLFSSKRNQRGWICFLSHWADRSSSPVVLLSHVCKQTTHSTPTGLRSHAKPWQSGLILHIRSSLLEIKKQKQQYSANMSLYSNELLYLSCHECSDRLQRQTQKAELAAVPCPGFVNVILNTKIVQEDEWTVINRLWFGSCTGSSQGHSMDFSPKCQISAHGNLVKIAESLSSLRK